MDKIQRDTMFAGLSDREMVEALVREMHHRRLLGCVYIFPRAGGRGAFGSSTPPDTISGLSASKQLQVFAEVAARGTNEMRRTVVSDDEDDTSNWVN